MGDSSGSAYRYEWFATELDREMPPFTGISRCRRRDSNPRHADFDSACGNRLSPVHTGDSGRKHGGWTRMWTHLSAGLQAVTAEPSVRIGHGSWAPMVGLWAAR